MMFAKRVDSMLLYLFLRGFLPTSFIDSFEKECVDFLSNNGWVERTRNDDHERGISLTSLGRGAAKRSIFGPPKMAA